MRGKRLQSSYKGQASTHEEDEIGKDWRKRKEREIERGRVRVREKKVSFRDREREREREIMRELECDKVSFR